MVQLAKKWSIYYKANSLTKASANNKSKVSYFLDFKRAQYILLNAFYNISFLASVDLTKGLQMLFEEFKK